MSFELHKAHCTRHPSLLVCVRYSLQATDLSGQFPGRNLGIFLQYYWNQGRPQAYFVQRPRRPLPAEVQVVPVSGTYPLREYWDSRCRLQTPVFVGTDSCICKCDIYGFCTRNREMSPIPDSFWGAGRDSKSPSHQSDSFHRVASGDVGVARWAVVIVVILTKLTGLTLHKTGCTHPERGSR